MYSTYQRIAAIARSIDDLAAETLAVPGDNRTGGADVRSGNAAGLANAGNTAGANADNATDLADANDASQVLVRLADLWSQLAELSPEVARRVTGYLT